MGYETWTDPILCWIGATGVSAYVIHIHGQRSRSSVETKLLFLLYCLTALFLVRGFYWLTDDARLQVPAFVPATLLPLAITLFVEALLRRHVSPAMKLFVALGTVTLFWLNLLNPISREALFTGYKIFTLSTIIWLGLVLAVRNRRTLSAMENSFIDAVTAALAFTFVLALTDMQMQPDWLPFRLGSIGGLIFVYVCLRLTDAGNSRRLVLGEMLGLAVKAAVAAIAFGLLVANASTNAYLAAFCVAVALVLLVAILERIREGRIRNLQTSFFQWLINLRAASLDDFIEALYQIPLAGEHLVLRGDQLRGYDVALLAGTFDLGRPVLTLSSLRASLAAGSRGSDGAEQLVDMLERHEMTHATMLSTAPAVILLLNLPEFAGGHNPVLQVGLIQKFGRLLRPA